MTGSKDKLDDFYEILRMGLTVERFLHLRKEIFGFVHSHELTKDYRLGRGRVKRLCDEVTPVARFVRECAKPEDWVSFTMDSQYPDCVVCHQDGRKRELEVTMAQARERFHLMSDLNETGTSRGFIGLTDNTPTQHFKDAMGSERQAYSTDEVISCIQHAIQLRVRKKKKYKGNTLLIEADLLILPSARWDEFRTRFTKEAKVLNFCEVYLTGRGDSGDIILKIK